MGRPRQVAADQPLHSRLSESNAQHHQRQPANLLQRKGLAARKYSAQVDAAPPIVTRWPILRSDASSPRASIAPGRLCSWHGRERRLVSVHPVHDREIVVVDRATSPFGRGPDPGPVPAPAARPGSGSWAPRRRIAGRRSASKLASDELFLWCARVPPVPSGRRACCCALLHLRKGRGIVRRRIRDDVPAEVVPDARERSVKGGG